MIRDHFTQKLNYQNAKYPLPSPKNDFYKIWTMGYGFRHVLMVQWGQASELKPHIWNDEDLWKKIRHFQYWQLPHSYHIVQILARKSNFSFMYLKGMKWPVLQSLSLEYICNYEDSWEKIHHFLSIWILWTATTWQK